MIFVVLTSFIQDISTVIERRTPGFYYLFPQPPERLREKAAAPETNILASSFFRNEPAILEPDTVKPTFAESSTLGQPPPSFLKRIASLTAVTGEYHTADNSGGGTATNKNDQRVPTPNVRYYVESEGFQCETFHVTTRDGFVLQLERISAGPGIAID
ncbi:hypothetical protein HK100_007172 [Physocladia obscura]|uniref:Partial AB-hydrolase lipase domain-containing protein n=1 Tax=Physocladia obscura TaxID=109957 RepID=A0AAD5SQM7_9FUNG|nr:hypothetical protein HK100_007172 [Physocladia obscura]